MEPLKPLKSALLPSSSAVRPGKLPYSSALSATASPLAAPSTHKPTSGILEASPVFASTSPGVSKIPLKAPSGSGEKVSALAAFAKTQQLSTPQTVARNDAVETTTSRLQRESALASFAKSLAAPLGSGKSVTHTDNGATGALQPLASEPASVRGSLAPLSRAQTADADALGTEAKTGGSDDTVRDKCDGNDSTAESKHVKKQKLSVHESASKEALESTRQPSTAHDSDSSDMDEANLVLSDDDDSDSDGDERNVKDGLGEDDDHASRRDAKPSNSGSNVEAKTVIDTEAAEADLYNNEQLKRRE